MEYPCKHLVKGLKLAKNRELPGLEQDLSQFCLIFRKNYDTSQNCIPYEKIGQ